MKKLFLVGIILLAAALRLYNLVSYPSGFNADEAALGYNAFSLLHTGSDEHGHPWPINLESFGDFKPAGYAYILIPFIKFMGLTELAVRLPSALLGIVAVAFIYLLTKEIISEDVGLLSSLLLAISPWHIHFSRGGWEVNAATTMLLIGVWAFIKWQKTSRYLFLGICILGFVASMYTYQSTRVVTPVLGLGLLVLFFSHFKKHFLQVILMGIILIVMLIPLAFSIIKSGASSRFSGVGFTSDLGPTNRVNELRGQHPNPNSWDSKLFHNRPIIYALQLLHNYTDHFGGDFLFVNGDIIQRNRVPETGLLYLSDFIFAAIGIIILIRNSNPLTKVIWLWLFVAPAAAALTFQTPHALRDQNMVIPLTIIVAVGVYSAIKKYKLLIPIIVVLYMWQTVRYLHEYYIHYPQTYPAAWEYGFKQLVPYVASLKNNYDHILVTDKYDQPYILFLFYSQYPPEKFQNHHILTLRDQFNFSTVRDFDKYHFASTSWEQVRDQHSSLIIAAPQDVPDAGVNIIKTFYFPNGQPVFKVISN